MDRCLNKIVGQRIKYCLECRGETQKEFAEKLGRSPASICRYIHGSRNVRVQDLDQIASALGVDIPYLVGEKDFPLEEGARLQLCNRAAKKQEFLSRELGDSVSLHCEGFELIKEKLISLKELSKCSSINYERLRRWYKAYLEGGKDAVYDVKESKIGRPRKKMLDI